MKKIIALLLSVLFVFSGCVQATEIVDLNDYDAIRLEYLQALSGSSLLGKNWKDAEELHPDSLIVFYLIVSSDEPVSRTDKNLPNYPAEPAEEFIQKFFDVSVEHLRTAKMYNEKENVYNTWGYGSAWSVRVRGAEQKGNQLYIDYEIYSEMRMGIKNVVLGYGTITIELLENGEFKYIKDKSYSIELPEMPVVVFSTPNSK